MAAEPVAEESVAAVARASKESVRWPRFVFATLSGAKTTIRAGMSLGPRRSFPRRRGRRCAP